MDIRELARKRIQARQSGGRDMPCANAGLNRYWTYLRGEIELGASAPGAHPRNRANISKPGKSLKLGLAGVALPTDESNVDPGLDRQAEPALETKQAGNGESRRYGFRPHWFRTRQPDELCPNEACL